MKRLDLYILGECLPTFMLSLAVFSFVLLIQKLSDMFDLVVAKGVPVWEVGKLLLLVYPAILSIVLPVSLLLAVLLAMGRLSADSEVVVMRACGVSLGRNLYPIVVLSAAVMAVCLAVTLWLGPTGRREFKQTVMDTVIGRLNISAEAGTFTELAPGVWLYAEKISEDGSLMEGMFLHTGSGKIAGTVVTARRGAISVGDGGFNLKLEEAEFHQAKSDGSYSRTRAASGRMIIPVAAQSPGEGDEMTVREATTSELFQKGFLENNHRSAMEFHRRFTVPVSCLMLGVLGAALGSHHFRSGNARGFALCLLLLFVNYALFTLGDTLARRQTIPVAAAMWMPDAVLAALAAWAVHVKNRERSFSFEEALTRIIAKSRSLFAEEEGAG